MILSIHLIELSPRHAVPIARAGRRSRRIPGRIWAQAAFTVPLAAGVFPPPRPTGVALIGAWADDRALDRFLADDPLAAHLANGWHTRLEPLRAVGGWSPLPGLADAVGTSDDDAPVAVLTLGRLRLLRAPAFFRASGAAERQAVANPGLVSSTAFARPPRLLGTFSVWQSAAAMRAYAYTRDGAHATASGAHHVRPFHHESVFARFRPYDARGAWHGFGESLGHPRGPVVHTTSQPVAVLR
jgi:hypothetical protein